ncbi:MAG: type II toxin-antitoxin system HipA family toxin [Rhodoferax sp.]|uniref:type II toxin-antitoxin system HipA family toxin n=1 Tax=Rhodoferax sp. TaxID=50421 RepID=UPI002626FF44|nr:type II toxin-antitoxin system HipA family toxin [Rhodoferax sp.]MDD5335469.1 type II toxin-antitoxin system HipA family toxin [Rhodoferax sp.]
MKGLGVWMNGEHVGTWSVGRTGNHRFEYEPSWPSHPRSRPLSLSLPFTANNQLEGAVVKNYFDNLLPDNESIRKRISARYKTRGIDTFTLLQAIGRDCVGAVQLLPVGQKPGDVQRLDYEKLKDEQVELLLSGLGLEAGTGAQDDDEGFRISIAGAQEKTALLRIGKTWCKPKGATPTTHILKPSIGLTPGRNLDLRLSVENEWLCNQILGQLNLPVAHCHPAIFGHRKALVVERFDRQWQDGGKWIVRIPQEDLCQAQGKSSDEKYESKGGPGIKDCLSVLKGSEAFESDGKHFLCAQLAFWLLAAIDGHAKNFSIFLLPGGRYRMTPLYDVLSAWPLIGTGPYHLQYKKTKLAMAVRSRAAHYRLSEISRRHWEELAKKSGVPQVWDALTGMIDAVEPALQTVESRLPPGFPAKLADAVFAGTRKHLERFRGAG